MPESNFSFLGNSRTPTTAERFNLTSGALNFGNGGGGGNNLPSDSLSVMSDAGTNFMDTDFSQGMELGTDNGPGMAGKWMKGGQLALGAGQLGLGIFNAVQTHKMNKFMKSYYGDQMDLQTAEFSNVARSANEALSSRADRLAGAKGQDRQQAIAATMDKWGVDESPV